MNQWKWAAEPLVPVTVQPSHDNNLLIRRTWSGQFAGAEPPIHCACMWVACLLVRSSRCSETILDSFCLHVLDEYVYEGSTDNG
jgi:hypothetical protein